MFSRGVEGSVDRDADLNRVIGSTQTDTMQGHWHNLYAEAQILAPGSGYLGWGGQVKNSLISNTGVKEAIADGTNGTPRTGLETRPENIAVAVMVKYAHTGTASVSLATTSVILASNNNWTGTNTFSGTDSLVISTFSKTLNGFTYMPGGMLFQWGHYAGGANSPTITFPKAFPTATLVVLCTPEDAGAGATNGLMASVFSIGATSFVCEINRHDATQYTTPFRWMAIGY
jgi:hypothetical protein